MKKYNGQALAIVLIILIIGVIVTLGIASRTNKDTLRNFEEKKSQDSTEVVNSVIDISRSVVTSEIQGNCATEFAAGQECCITYQNGNLTKNFVNIPSASTFPSCSYSKVPDNYTKLCFQPTYDVENFTLKKDEVINFGFTSPALAANSCTSLDFTFNKIGSNSAGIVVSKIYSQRDASGNVIAYKPYGATDFRNFLLPGSTDATTVWNGWGAPRGTWSFLGVGTPSDTGFVVGGYLIGDLRVRAVGSDVTLNMTANSCDTTKMDPFFMKVTASSNCSGTFKSSYYYRPLKNGALSLFDFTLYNKNGDMNFSY